MQKKQELPLKSCCCRRLCSSDVTKAESQRAKFPDSGSPRFVVSRFRPSAMAHELPAANGESSLVRELTVKLEQVNSSFLDPGPRSS